MIGAAAAAAAGGAAVRWARGRPPAPVRPALAHSVRPKGVRPYWRPGCSSGRRSTRGGRRSPNARGTGRRSSPTGSGAQREKGSARSCSSASPASARARSANAVLGRRIAATGSGAPVTRGVNRHRSRDGLTTLVDTEGLELGEVDARRSEHLLALAALADVVWYCVQAGGERFQASEAELIEALAAVRPTLIVLTQAVEPPAELARLIQAHHAESRSWPSSPRTACSAIGPSRGEGSTRCSRPLGRCSIAMTLQQLVDCPRCAVLRGDGSWSSP